jgi:hypothetical protein
MLLAVADIAVENGDDSGIPLDLPVGGSRKSTSSITCDSQNQIHRVTSGRDSFIAMMKSTDSGIWIADTGIVGQTLRCASAQ